MAQNLFRKKRPNQASSVTSLPTKGDLAAINQELSIFIYQLILALPNAYRDQFNAPFPTTIDEYMDSLLRMLPKEWPELASSAALNRMTALRYPSFASFQHFLWEFRRLKLVAQCSDRKAFLIFLAIIPTDLRMAISRSGIAQYSQLIRVEEYDNASTKGLVVDSRVRKPLRLDLHKDRLLFALHIPSRLFNKIVKSKHKLIDSIAMSWFRLSADNESLNVINSTNIRNHIILNLSNENNSTRATITENGVSYPVVKKSPSYVYSNSSTKSLPLFARRPNNEANTQAPTTIAVSANTTLATTAATATAENPQEVIICDNIIFYNEKLHLSQGLITSIIKHWYHCFTSNIQQADGQIFDLLVGNSFSYKPFFDFSNILKLKPDQLHHGSDRAPPFPSKDGQRNNKYTRETRGYPHQTHFNSSTTSTNTSTSTATNTVFSEPIEEEGEAEFGYYRPWQVVKMSYISGAELSDFANPRRDVFHLEENGGSNNASRNTSRSNSGRSQDSHRNFTSNNSSRNNLTSNGSGGMSRTGTGSSQHTSHNSINERHSTKIGIKRTGSHMSTSSDASSYYTSLFSDSLEETASSGTFSSTQSASSLIEEEDDEDEEETPSPKDILIITCCETLEIFLGVIDPSDPPAAIIQTVLIPFAHQYGYPLAVLTDRSAPSRLFTSQLFQKFWKAHGSACFHLATMETEGTSISEIHISFIKTYLACFAQELQTQLVKDPLPGSFRSASDSRSAPGQINQQGATTTAAASTNGSKRGKDTRKDLVDITLYRKRIMATLNDFVSYYDTNIDSSSRSGFGGLVQLNLAKVSATSKQHTDHEQSQQPTVYPENIVRYYSDLYDESLSDEDDDEEYDVDALNSSVPGHPSTSNFSDDVFYRALGATLRTFTNVTKMHSTKCAPLFDHRISQENLLDWSMAVPWKPAPTNPDPTDDNAAVLTQLPTYHHSVSSNPTTARNSGGGAPAYEAYKRSLMTNRPSSTSQPSYPQTKNHVIIRGKILPIDAILGYCEYLSIPCFLIQTTVGLCWVTGFQMSECTRDLQASIKSIYRIRGQPVPRTLRFLTNPNTFPVRSR